MLCFCEFQHILHFLPSYLFHLCDYSGLMNLSLMNAFISVNFLGCCCEITSNILTILSYISSLFLIFFSHVCVCVWLCISEGSVHRGPQILCSWSYRILWPVCPGCWKLKSGPLQKQFAFLPTESSLQPISIPNKLIFLTVKNSEDNCNMNTWLDNIIKTVQNYVIWQPCLEIPPQLIGMLSQYLGKM